MLYALLWLLAWQELMFISGFQIYNRVSQSGLSFANLTCQLVLWFTWASYYIQNWVALQIYKIEAALAYTIVDLKHTNVHADLTIYDREFHHQTDSNSSLPVVFYESLGWPGLGWPGWAWAGLGPVLCKGRVADRVCSISAVRVPLYDDANELGAWFDQYWVQQTHLVHNLQNT